MTALHPPLVIARARCVQSWSGPCVEILDGEHAQRHFRVLQEQKPLVRALRYGCVEPEVTVRFHPDDPFARIIGWQE